MNQIIFESDRRFEVSDIVISHGQLLIRSLKNDKETKTIDIVFFNTTYIQLSTLFYGVKLSFEKNNLISYKSVEKYLSYKNNHLFQLESLNEKYYIAASFLKVFENDLDVQQSSLGFNEIGREKMLIASYL